MAQARPPGPTGRAEALSEAIVIRPYRAEDRPAVRTIACDTAAGGEPVERFFHDRELFADLLTGYYTEWEPHALWIAEYEGRVVGYLTGCLDERRYRRVMGWAILPAAVIRGLLRGVWCHPSTWRLFRAAVQTWQCGGFSVPFRSEGYPAHVHVNIRQGVRGRGIGERLVRQFLQQAAVAGCPGMRAAIRSDNAAACRFFERLGFTELARHPVVFPSGTVLERRETLIYGAHVTGRDAEEE